MKKIISFLMMLIILYITSQVLLNSKSVIETVAFSLKIFKENVFPSLFPFLVLSGLLVNYGFVEFCSVLFSPIMKLLFNMNGAAAYVFIMSLISGFPSSSKYIRDLYLKGLLSVNEATKLLMFTHFSNPLFILGTVGLLLKQTKIAILILICHYTGNLIIGILVRNLIPYEEKNITLEKNTSSFGCALKDSITSAIDTLLLVLGTITFFLILTTLLAEKLNLSGINQTIMNGIFEMTQGLKFASLLNTDLRTKAVLMTMFLSFGGISVHAQIMSIISDTKIRYIPFFVARLLHAAISGLLVFLLYSII